jgi:MFS family permease
MDGVEFRPLTTTQANASATSVEAPGEEKSQSVLMWLVGLPPLTRRQRNVLELNVWLEIVGEYGILLSGLSLSAIESSLRISDDALSMLSAITSLAGVISIFYALLGDAYGRTYLLHISVPAGAFFSFASGLATNAWWWTAFSFAVRLAPGFPGLAFLVEEMPSEGRGLVASFIGFGAALGALAALFFWWFVGDYTWGWRAMVLLHSVPLIVLSFKMLFDPNYLPESRCFLPSPGNGFEVFVRPLGLFFKKTHRRLLIIYFIFTFVFGVTYASTGKFIFVHLTNECGYSSKDNSELALLGIAFAIPLSILVGKYQDKFGRIPTGQVIWIFGGLINAFFYLAPCDSVLVPISFVLVVCIPQFARITVTKLVGAELFQTEHRCLAGSLVGVVSAVSTALGFMLYPVLSEKFSEREAQVIFALSSMLITLVWSMLPETAGVPMNDLNDNGTEAESKNIPYGSVSLNRAAFVGARVSLT